MAIPPVEVFWRGRSLGWTPLRDYKLPEGTHELTLRLHDGETYKVSQTITAGRSALRKWKRP